MAKKSVTIHFAVEPNDKADLSREARELTLPLSFVVRRIVRDYLKQKEKAKEATA